MLDNIWLLVGSVAQLRQGSPWVPPMGGQRAPLAEWQHKPKAQAEVVQVKAQDAGVNVPVNPPSVAAKTTDPSWP